MSKKKTQKIIIPKGTINPNEDTLIEIPSELKTQPIVVAKKDGYKEKNVSIEATSKNIVYEGSKYSVLEDSSRVKIVDTLDRRATPMREKSLRISTAPEATPPVFPSNESKFKEDAVIGRKLDDMLRAKKDLQETALLATKTPQLSNISCQTCPTSVASEIPTKSTRSTLSNTVSGDNVRQQSRTQNTSSCTASSKGTGSCIKDQCPAATSQDDPPFKSTKGSAVQISRSLPTYNSIKTTSGTAEKEEEKRISFRVDKNTSDICIEVISSKLSKPPCQDKGVQSEFRNVEEKRSEELIPRRKRSRDNCKKFKRESKKESLTERDSATSWREDRMGSHEKLKRCDKCSSQEIDDIYIEQLKSQFDDAKRKLDDAVMLASMSLKKLSDKRYSATSKMSEISNKGSFICDSVPERDVSFVPLCGSKQSYVVFVPSSSNTSCRILNQEENKVQSHDFTPRDASNRNDIYKNIIYRKATDEPRKSPVQNESDSPDRAFSMAKDNLKMRSADVNKTSPVSAPCRYPAQRENEIPCPAFNLTSPDSRIIREKRKTSDSSAYDRAPYQRESSKQSDVPVRINIPLESAKDTQTRGESAMPIKKPQLIFKENIVQTEKTALPARISRCSCSEMKGSGSVRFMKEPRSNFSNSSSIADKGSSLI